MNLPNFDSLLTVKAYRTAAQHILPKPIFDYIDAGAADEVTSRLNEQDLAAIRLRPLVFRNVGRTSFSTSFFGVPASYPIGLSPTALHALAHDTGELASARAAKTLNIPMIVSCMSSVSIESIAASSKHDKLWLQVYLFKDRSETLNLIERAATAGISAIVLSAGVPILGRRLKSLASGFTIPPHIKAGNFSAASQAAGPGGIALPELDPTATWSDLERLLSRIKLPVLLKGVMTAEDARIAANLPVSGILISNHGGRQLDSTDSSINALRNISHAIGQRLPLFVDSGFRSGTDLLKAYALGADAVFLGRPVFWGLAAGGESGLTQLLTLLCQELCDSARLVGCSNIDELRAAASHIISDHSVADRR